MIDYRDEHGRELPKLKLLETGDAHLEEGNDWGDRYCGTVHGVGQNKYINAGKR